MRLSATSHRQLHEDTSLPCGCKSAFLLATDEASLLIVVGTSGATNLPMQMRERVHRRGGAMLVINRDPSPFSEMVESSPRGFFARGSAGSWMGPVAAHLGAV